MNKRSSILIGTAIIILIGVYFLTNKPQKTRVNSNQTLSDNVTYFPNTTSSDNLAFDDKSGKVYKIDGNGSPTLITSLENTESYSLSLSPNESNLLYTNSSYQTDHIFMTGENPDAESLTVKSLGQDNSSFKVENIISPAWLNDTLLTYQELTGNNIVVYDVVQKREIKRLKNPLRGQVYIKPLDENTIVLSDIITDVSPALAQILDISTDETTKLTEGENLSVKTKLGSNILAFSRADGNNTLGILYNWHDKKIAYQFLGDANETDWNEDLNLFFYIDQDSKLKKLHISEKSEDIIAIHIGVPSIMKINLDGKLYIKVDGKSQVY